MGGAPEYAPGSAPKGVRWDLYKDEQKRGIWGCIWISLLYAFVNWIQEYRIVQ